MGDLFQPRLCDAYVRLFTDVIAYVRPELKADSIGRYNQIRQPRRAPDDVQNIFVLSRVTLGADVAVTSVVLSALKQRYPKANIHFVGPRKNWGSCSAADPRIQHCAFSYGRSGSLRQRLASQPYFEDGIVVDPDSRITQLGLLPVCPEQRLFVFESRSYGAESEESLSGLTSRWASETFGVTEARAYIAPLRSCSQPDVTVSFGVGENQEKRIEDPFE